MKVLVSIAACLAMVCGVVATPAHAADYVGARKCKMCHKKAHAKWEETKHAQAFSSLQGDDAENPECVGCHTTGYPGSGPVAEDMKNVQCEACHGPGSDYRKVMMRKSSYTTEKAVAAGLIVPNEATCTQCHNEKNPNFKPFNFEERKAQIAHTLDKPRS
ncbi:MAG: cytochrome c family protein [Nitrospirota bacterium]|jgi:hypothetical protein